MTWDRGALQRSRMVGDCPGLRAIWAVERRFCPMDHGLLWPRASRDTGRAMSQENVEVGEPVRRLWAALNKRDWDAFSAELDPEMEYTPREEHAVYRGPEAVIQYAERWLEAWDTFFGRRRRSRAHQQRSGHLSRCAFGARARGAESRSTTASSGFTSCAVAGSIASASTPTEPKPSKPPDCRQKRAEKRRSRAHGHGGRVGWANEHPAVAGHTRPAGFEPATSRSGGERTAFAK